MIAPFERGQAVEVTEQGIRPWVGTVTSVKHSRVSGWWVDVRTDRGTYVIAADLVKTKEEDR